ncbi:hypothetical protein HCH54_000082 [Aspergillus fumigatus]
MLIVHHLQRSQSERIVWLCEELGIPYELRTYQRDAKTLLAPPELQQLHPTQAGPVIQDGTTTLAESYTLPTDTSSPRWWGTPRSSDRGSPATIRARDSHAAISSRR